MNRDITGTAKVRIIATYTHTKQLIALLQREYANGTNAIYFTPQLAPHPGLGTTHLIINYFQPRNGAQ